MASPSTQRRTKRSLLAKIAASALLIFTGSLVLTAPAHATDDPPPVVDPVGSISGTCVGEAFVLTASGSAGTFGGTAYIGVNSAEAASLAVDPNSPFSFSYTVPLAEGTAFNADLQFGDLYGSADSLNSGSFTIDCVAPDPDPDPDPDPEKKVWVCKYVGTPGVDEVIKPGENPISVAVNSIQNNQWDGTVPGYFSDAHDRSYVAGYDDGGPAPDCPDGDTDPEPINITTGPSVTPPTCDLDGSLVIPTIEHVTFAGGVNGAGPGTYHLTATADEGYVLTGDTGPWDLTVLPDLEGTECGELAVTGDNTPMLAGIATLGLFGLGGALVAMHLLRRRAQLI